MGFFSKVNQGDHVMHSAARENGISDMLNRFPHTGDSGNAPFYPGRVYLLVMNLTGKTLAAGTPVVVESGKIPKDAPLIPSVKKAQAGDCYGIVTEEIKNEYVGHAVFLGIVEIALSKALPIGTRFVAPNGDGGFVAADSGRAEVLWSDATRAVLLLSGESAAYTGSFAVTVADGTLNVSAGYLNRNGEFLAIPKITDIAAGNGTLCLCTTIDDSGKWTKPEIKIAEPAADAYPLAAITVEKQKEGEKTRIAVRQYPVTVAVIMLAKPCPLAEF